MLSCTKGSHFTQLGRSHAMDGVSALRKTAGANEGNGAGPKKETKLRNNSKSAGGQ